MRILTIYISGAITGCVDLNRAKFTAAEVWLLGIGHEAVNPHKLPADHDKTWYSYMRACIGALVNCDAVIALDDWHKSRGAIREIIVAKWLNIPVYAAYTDRKVKISPWIIIKLLLKRI